MDEKESNPDKRYKMVGSARGYRAAYSSDGLDWKYYPGNPIMSGGDTITAANN